MINIILWLAFVPAIITVGGYLLASRAQNEQCSYFPDLCSVFAALVWLGLSAFAWIGWGIALLVAWLAT